jgi:RNA 3'-terminal phosphate cyclase (ATP)
VTEVFASLGEKSLMAVTVAKRLLNEVPVYLKSDAPVGAHLTHQLMLPMAARRRWRFHHQRGHAACADERGGQRRFLPVRFI